MLAVMQTKSRLLGLAFASADALIEIAGDGTVVFCAGAGPDAGTPLTEWRGRALGLGVEEDSAAIVRAGVAEAAGARGLLIVDASQAVVEASAPLRVRELRLSYVDRGDRYDLQARRVLLPATRQLLEPGPEQGRPGFFGDILGDNVLVGAMARAAEGAGRLAIGLAWRPEQALAFEWRLSADAHTRAWGGPTRDDHTIEALRLDIHPVRLAQPVYEPLPADGGQRPR